MNQITKVNLKKLKYCHENWAEMTPSEKGKICGSCKKEIIDFRQKTLKEIAETHAFSEEPVCGIYTENQLENKENPPTIIKTNWWNQLKYSTLGFVGLLTTLPLVAQDKPKETKTEQHPNPQHIKNDQLSSKQAKRIIQGVIYDQLERPVQYASIILPGHKIGATSNSSGEFMLDLNPVWDELPENFIIKIKGISYKNKSFHFSKKDFERLFGSKEYEFSYKNLRLNTVVSRSQFYALERPIEEKKQETKKNLFYRIGKFFRKLFSKK
jgi:hypothetical protein